MSYYLYKVYIYVLTPIISKFTRLVLNIGIYKLSIFKI